ncbi:MAG: UDP-glucose 4-epimerase GalE [Defluviitaleaceae bacterium]|nr:UDP-glucose 4-epimerase GalE [Defluviitaleaceae bacterium]
MAVLVCGGAGYIGSHMTAALVQKGYDTIVVDNLDMGHKAAVWPGATFYEANISDTEAMDRIFAAHDIDAVVNFAAHMQVGESVENPAKYYDNNITGTLLLLDQMLKHGVKKIVFSSSASVYGIPDKTPITEDMPNAPISPYAETKLAAEKIFKWYDNAYGLKFVALRYFNVAGAHESGQIGEDHSPETHLIPVCLQAAQGKTPTFKMFGDDYPTPDGTCIRDYVHVMDLADAHILALEKLNRDNTSAIYNLGSQNGFSNKEIVAMVKEVTGADFPVEIHPRRAGDPPALIASSDKIRSELGWNPTRTTIENIIKTAWAWHAGHPNGYGDQ